MRLVTFRHENRERIGVQLESYILDLSRVSARIPTDMKAFLSLGQAALDQTHEVLASVKEEWLLAESDVTLLAPIPRPDKILCVGHNYAGHIGIGKTELPEYPNLFSKTVNTITAHNQPILFPPVTTQADFEAELMAVIGKRAYQVSESEAESCIAGYTISNDVSAPDYQKRTTQWMLGKSFDTFGPMGQALITTDEVPDPYSLHGIDRERTPATTRQYRRHAILCSVPDFIHQSGNDAGTWRRDRHGYTIQIAGSRRTETLFASR